MSSAKDSPPKEQVLRDRLAGSLEIIETDLTLIRVEYPLPNVDGARGSIDILAKDRSGNYVIIELKRSDQTARQALHELNKYVSLLASHAGVRTDQLRCILLSTTWHELRVPFARFAADAAFHALGLQLELDDAGYPSSVGAVDLPDVAPGLETCPKHIDLLYFKSADRDAVIKGFQRALTELSIVDYFALAMDYRGIPERVMYPFSLYIVFAELSQELRDRIAETYQDEHEEDIDSGDWAEEELMQSALIKRVPWDTVEIGSPDRFKASEDDWEVVKTIRRGAYAATLWSDADLVGLTSAHGGKYSAAFDRQVQVANRAAWTRMLSDVQYCLTGADPWPELVDAVLAEIALRPQAEVLIHAYSPCDLIWGLAHFARSGGDRSYMPEIVIEMRDGNEARLYHGILMWDGLCRPQTLEKVFNDLTRDLFGYLMVRAAGGIWEIDTELCARHGLRYQLLEFFPGSDERIFQLVIKNGKMVRHKFSSDDDSEIRPWSEFFEDNREYLNTLVKAIDSMTVNLG